MKTKKYSLRLTVMFLVMLAAFTLTAFAGVHGDINNDNAVTAADARLALRASVRLEKYAEGSAEFAAADVDFSKDITAADARLILRVSVGLEKLAHTEVTDSAVAPTCAETGLTEGSHCPVCGEVIKAQETVPALPHTAVTDNSVAPTCTEAGLTEGSHCSVCGEVIKARTPLRPLGHTEVTDKAVAPTCTKAGLTEGSHCSTCGTVLKEQTAVEATGHRYEEKIASECRAATCTEDGADVFRCTGCGEKSTTVIEAPGHKFNVDEATCTQDKVCTVCGEVFDHAFNSSVNVLKDGTHTFSGFSHKKSVITTGSENMKFSTSFKAMLRLVGSAAGEDLPTEKGMLNELRGMIYEFFSEDDSYSFPLTDVKITKFDFDLIGMDEVSLLADTDVKSVKRETVNGIDFLNELGDSVSVYGYEYSLDRFKSADIGEVSKVTVELNDDRYSLIKDSAAPTGIMNITDLDLRELAEDFNISIKDMDIGFEDMDDACGIKCKDGTASAAVTYYFDKADNSPIAAKYQTSYAFDASCYLDFTGASVTALILGDSPDAESDMKVLEAMADMFGFGKNDSLIKGYVDFNTAVSETQYYFFDDYFPSK